MRGLDPKEAVVVNFAEASASQKRRDSYESHRHRVYALAFYMMGGELEAEEVLAHTFVRAFRHCDEPSGKQVDKCLVAELTQHVEFAPVEPGPVPVIAAGVSLAAQANVKRSDLEAALEHLPATERMVFLLRDVESYPVDRVAELLEIAPSAVNLALFRARLKLRHVLAQASSQEDPLQLAG